MCHQRLENRENQRWLSPSSELHICALVGCLAPFIVLHKCFPILMLNPLTPPHSIFLDYDKNVSSPSFHR